MNSHARNQGNEVNSELYNVFCDKYFNLIENRILGLGCEFLRGLLFLKRGVELDRDNKMINTYLSD